MNRQAQPNPPVRRERPDLSITMAVADDYDGAYFTIQGIRNNHDCSAIEFVVVDNKPESPSSKALAGFVQGMARTGTMGSKYIPLALPKGTAPPRDLAIRSASSPYVLQVDSHILLRPGALDSLLAYWKENPQSDDILSGPLVMDDFQKHFTHFDAVWRSEMWGVWASAWACACYNPTTHRNRLAVVDEDAIQSLRFTIKQHPGKPDGAKAAEFIGLYIEEVPVAFCPKCNRKLPDCTNGNHAVILKQNGYKEIGYQKGEQPFEIPGQGLGLFSVRRDSWLGFNPHFRGFGGEELYIHTKYNQHGRKALCIPDLKWVHRFGRPSGVTYPLSKYLKVRNYVLGFTELGMDLQPIKEHFVREGQLSQEVWDHIVADPVGNETEPGKKDPMVSLPQPPKRDGKFQVNSLQDLYDFSLNVSKRDLDKHLPKLLELAQKCSHVTEIARRREGTIALAYGCENLVSFNAEAADPIMQAVVHFAPKAKIIDKQPQLVTEIDETDLLFLDAVATYDAVKTDLAKFASKVRRYIVLHRSKTNGEIGENSKRGGVRTALREFLRTNPRWSVIEHSNEGQGLTILSCDPADKPPLPPVTQMASNFLGSMASFVSDGMRLVDKDLYEARLMTCSDCPQRNGNSCSVCGCGLAAKAQLKADGCPLGFWPDQKPKTEETPS